MILVSQLLSAAVQLLLLTAVPLLWYAVSRRRLAGFWRWLGLYPAAKAPVKAMCGIFLGLSLATLLPYWYLYRTDSLTYSGFTVDSFRQTGWSAQTVAVLLLWAVVQTSLTEEIFFRGFLCKRLSEKWGWRTGCAVQAALFGALHLPAVWGKGLLPALVILLLTGGIGFALGWLCQRRAGGSILYGWCIHAVANILSTVVVFRFLLTLFSD